MKSKHLCSVKDIYISADEDKRRANANRIIKQYIQVKLKSRHGGCVPSSVQYTAD